jgi:hypothetical protein
LVQGLLPVVQLLIQVALLFTEQLLKHKKSGSQTQVSRSSNDSGKRQGDTTNLLTLQIYHLPLQGTLGLFNPLEPLGRERVNR